MGSSIRIRSDETNSPLGGKTTGIAVCEAIDTDGDKRLTYFSVAADGKLMRETVTGTGKYDGMVASGKVEPYGPFSTIKAKTQRGPYGGGKSRVTSTAHPRSCKRKARKAPRVTRSRPHRFTDVISFDERSTKELDSALRNRSGQLTICVALSGYDG